MGLAGLGGYAGSVCETLLQATDAKLIAVYEPNYSPHVERVEKLKAAGVVLCDSYEALLKQPIEAVWLPVPIHLHRPYTEQALEQGIAVLCEKPAAGTVQDLDAMIATRDRTGVPAAIAFQHLTDPAILRLKQRLVAGEFGKIKSLSVRGCWPRSSGYFGRNNWAGRMRVADTWVLDSPLANAMNHFLQLAMYFGGAAVGNSAMPARVEAEMYRVNPIENFDTCSLRITLDQGAPMLVLMTHACQTQVNATIRIRCNRGDIVVHPEDRIDLSVGEKVEMMPIGKAPRRQMERSFRDFLRHAPDAPAIATLEIAKAPLVVVNAVAMAAPITTLSNNLVREVAVRDGTLRFIPGIEAAFESCEANSPNAA